jgi:hypothetical protein
LKRLTEMMLGKNTAKLSDVNSEIDSLVMPKESSLDFE